MEFVFKLGLSTRSVACLPVGVECDKLTEFAARLSLSAEIHSVPGAGAIEFFELHLAFSAPAGFISAPVEVDVWDRKNKAFHSRSCTLRIAWAAKFGLAATGTRWKMRHLFSG